MKIKGSGFINFLRDQLRVVILFAVVLFVAAGWLWWDGVVKKPQNVFARMLVNSLQTTSYGRHSSQSDGLQSLNIDAINSLAPFHRTHSINSLDQGESTQIVTENLSDSSVNFVRYNSIQTAEKSSSGEPFDFSEVLYVWGRQDARVGENGPSQIYTQNVLLPLVNLSPQQRSQLLNQIWQDNVYVVDYSQVRRETVNGRAVYTYPTLINPVPYIKMIKSLASMYGLSHLNNLDPAQYENIPPLKFDFQVDLLSAQLVGVVYSDGSRTEKFSSYGAIDTTRAPEAAISVEELQQRLQQIQ
jgi:hypothetical protein